MKTEVEIDSYLHQLATDCEGALFSMAQKSVVRLTLYRDIQLNKRVDSMTLIEGYLSW
jgi:hypothetical protein